MKNSFRTTYTAFLLYGVATSAILAPSAALAINISPTLAAGSATISQAGNVTTVNQSTQKAIYNATSLDTTSAQTLNVNTPTISSIGLFKVSGAATKFDGILNSNGQVWIVNPNGALFGSTAKVNVGGLLVSTAGISNENFLNPSVINGQKKYIFDQAGNAQAAIVVRSGAQITAKYPDGTYEVKMAEAGGEVGAGGSSTTGTIDAQDLTNWILKPGTSVDSKNKNDSGTIWKWDYDKAFTDAAGHKQFFDMEGTDPTGTKGAAVLTSKKSFDLAAGEYKINFDAAGSNRTYDKTASAKDGLLIEVIDAKNNVLYSNKSTFSQTDGWTSKELAFALDKPVQGLRLRVSGTLEGVNQSDYLGASLGKLDFSYRPYESPYVTFMAPAIRQETGSNVQAIHGAINYAAGTTFEANAINDKTVTSVKINDPVRMAAIIDGKPATSAVEIQQGAQLWAALVPDSPLGTVTIQAKVEQGVFNSNFDKNGNGTNEHVVTTGPLNQVYDSSEIVTIANGADIRPAPVKVGGGEGGNQPIKDNGNLTIISQIVPGGTVTPPVVTPVTPPLSQNLQVAPPVADLTFAQLSARDVVSRNFVNATDSVDPTISVSGGLSLAQKGGAVLPQTYANLSPAAGGSAGDYANLSPAAGGSATTETSTSKYSRLFSPEEGTMSAHQSFSSTTTTRTTTTYGAGDPAAADYANMAPAAGGNKSSRAAAGTDVGQAACANETLDNVSFLKEKIECRRQPEI